jgi:hypothetical protein
MENCQVRIEDEDTGSKSIRRDSYSSVPEPIGHIALTCLHAEGQVLDDHNNIRNVDRLLKTAQLCHGKTTACSPRSSSNCQKSDSQCASEKQECDATWLVDSDDLRSGDFTDDIVGEVEVGAGRVCGNSESLPAGNHSRNSPSLVIDNWTRSSDHDCEINTTNSFESKLPSCELDIQTSSEGNITQDCGFGIKNVDVPLNLEESDSTVKTSDDSGEFLECSDILHEEIACDHSDSLHIDTDLSSLHRQKCFDEPEDRSCTRDVLMSNDYHNQDENDEYRAQEEQNRKNRRIIRGNVMSDVLIISDPDPVADVTPPQIGCSAENSLSRNCVLTKKKKVQQRGDITVGSSGPSVKGHSADKQKSPLSVNLNPDECTWDMMFDDNGDCLDPKLMEEVSICK